MSSTNPTNQKVASFQNAIVAKKFATAHPPAISAFSEYLLPKLRQRIKLARDVKQKDSQELTLQSGDRGYTWTPTMPDSIYQKFDRYVARHINGYFGTDRGAQETAVYLQKLLEDVLLLFENLVRAKDGGDQWRAIYTYAKLRMSGPFYCMENLEFVMSKARDIGKDLVAMFLSLFGAELEVQGAEEIFKGLRGGLDRYSEIRNAPIFKKLYRFSMYALSLSLFDRIGVTFDSLSYTQLESEAIRRKFHGGIDFIHTMADTLLFLCERGYQCLRTGSMDPIYHSGSSYESWFDTAAELVRKSAFLGNPEPHGFDRFSFLTDLGEAIEHGQAIHKHAVRLGEFERSLVRKLLSDLLMIRCNETTKRAALQSRKPPFSVLLFGGSSVAKSLLTDLLFYHYGALFSLPTGAEFKFTRNAADQFWSGFTSAQWCVILDDIAFRHPNATTDGDATVMEMLQLVNGVAFNPPQADLPDKGKTPVRARFVIATTNTEHLNAHAYFACPLAARRRLPFILDVTPKAQYLKHGCMIDSSKLPVLADGEYPDFWNIVVKRVVPGSTDRMTQRGATEVLHEFDSIYPFMAWFSKTALEHEDTQDKASACSKTIREVVLCVDCHLPASHCECVILQAQDVPNVVTESWMDEPEVADDVAALADLHEVVVQEAWFSEFCARWLKFCFLEFALFRNICLWFYQFPCVYRFYWKNSPTTGEDVRFIRSLFGMMGVRIQKKIGVVPFLTTCVAMIGSGVLLYKFSSSLSELITRRTPFVPETQEVEEPRRGRAPVPSAGDRPNVWKNDSYQLSRFDVSDVSTSFRSLSLQSVEQMILRNCVTFRTHYVRERDGVMCNVIRPTRAFCVAGHVFVCNNHGLPELESLDLEIVSAIVAQGVTGNVRVRITSSQIKRFPAHDLAFVLLRCGAPGKDLTQLFCKSTLAGSYHASYLSRLDSGETQVKPVMAAKRVASMPCQQLGISVPSWAGRVVGPTVSGDCGSVLLAQTALGPVILGLHYLGSPDGQVGAILVSEDMIRLGLAAFKGLIVQAGVPALSAPSASRVIGDLDNKSPFRFFTDGTAQVYGSFLGHRPRRSSSVCATLIQKSMVDRGYAVKFGPPVMTGWEPWRIVLQDMLHPVTAMDTSVLAHCVDTFIHDIRSRITPEELAMVHVYDEITAVNGAPGVSFVDKLNRNTSTGAPWNCPKKRFLTPTTPIGDILDPVLVDDEVMSRVRVCIAQYEKGVRYMPVFTANLKDEPIKFAKIAARKTRAIAGAPMDWTIAVRMYLLSVIRVVQSNRFLFGSAPGTIAQSTEWGQIRDFLCAFGEDRVVAGDYRAFDKSMPSVVILAAFDVLSAICEMAGYSSAELLVVAGIAEDTAFPLMNFNGDLVQFLGSNPSGHPLTVIINGIANVLYMRYCYVVLSPSKSCVKFIEHVNLMTYGDDNAMGVSPDAPFFNHTSIQGVLAGVGIEYTMADKESASVPYIHIDDVSFLKRSWRWDADVGAFLCPLEHASIEKMLTVCVRSKTITQEEQSIAVLSTALREYFYYGREVYEEKMTLFQDVVDENCLNQYVQETSFPTWESLKSDFWKNSTHVVARTF